MSDPKEFFTVVFEGRLRDIEGNPYKIESPFGRAVATGMGDAISRQDLFEDLLIAAHKARALADHCSKNGIHEIEFEGEVESVADLSGDLSCAINVAETRLTEQVQEKKAKP